MSAARLSVSLVTFNGMRWLGGCLDSLRAQTFTDFELRVVDNASTDGTREQLRRAVVGDPRMSVHESERNVGFAAAHNRGIFGTRSDLVMLLNQDVVLDPGFLAAAVGAFDGRPRVAAVQGRLRRLGPAGERTTMIDSTGLAMHRDRRVVARRQGEHETERDHVAGPVWGADGPAPIYRRAALMEAREPRTGGGWEVLDEDFFMYKEDVDLAWRLRRLGWTAWYEPRALAWHGRGAGGPVNRGALDMIRSRHAIPRWILDVSWRNHRLMQIKNEAVSEYLRDLPWIMRREALSLTMMSLDDPRRLRILAGLARGIPAAARKRTALKLGRARTS